MFRESNQRPKESGLHHLWHVSKSQDLDMHVLVWIHPLKKARGIECEVGCIHS